MVSLLGKADFSGVLSTHINFSLWLEEARILQWDLI